MNEYSINWAVLKTSYTNEEKEQKSGTLIKGSGKEKVLREFFLVSKDLCYKNVVNEWFQVLISPSTNISCFLKKFLTYAA